MEVPFLLGGVPAVFRRNSRSGRADLTVGERVIEVQNPYRISAHIRFQNPFRRSTSGDQGHIARWLVDVDGRTLEITMDQAGVSGGMRSHTITIVDDGTVIAQGTGV